MTIAQQREALCTLVARLVLFAEREADDRPNVLDWIDGGGELYRAGSGTTVRP